MPRPPHTRGRLAARGRLVRASIPAVLVIWALGSFSNGVEAKTIVGRAAHTFHPRRGLTLTTVHYADGPVEVRVLQFTPKPKSLGYTVEPGISGPVITTHTTPSTLGSELGAVAAMNGDFSVNGQPAHFNAVDGDVRTSGLINGSGFAISRNEKFAWTGHTHPSITADPSTGGSFLIDHWNGDDKDGPGGPLLGEITAYTKDGGIKQNPDEDACAVRLIDPGPRFWSDASRTAFSRTWEIGDRVCQHDRLVVGSDPGNVVLDSHLTGVGADALNALPLDGTLTISWQLEGWPGILDVIGGQPAIVKDVVNVGPPQTTGSSYFYKDNPRSAIGITEGCSDDDTTTACGVIYMVVDGRREGWSIGMNLKELGEEMLKFGAYNATNIDGGGSSALWLNDKGPWCITDVNGGCLTTKPSDGAERATLTSMLVLQGRDLNEPPVNETPRTSVWDTWTLTNDTTVDWDALALSDPASTGGLLDALDERGRLPAQLRPLLREYRMGT
jgi:hypothetical protein